MEQRRYVGYDKVIWRPMLQIIPITILLVEVATHGTLLLFIISLLFVYSVLNLFKCYGLLYAFRGYNIYDVSSDYYVISKKKCLSNYRLEEMELIQLSKKYHLDPRPF